MIHHLLSFVSEIPELSQEKTILFISFKKLIQDPVTDLNDKRILLETSLLASTMNELGYSCTSSLEILNDVFNQFQNTSEQDIGQVVGMMCSTYSSLEDTTKSNFYHSIQEVWKNEKREILKLNSWNTEVFTNFIKKKYPNLKNIIKYLDYQGFKLKDQKGFALLTSIQRKLDDKSFPIDSIIGELWNNRKGQLSIISFAIEAPPDIINFGQSQRKVFIADPSIKKSYGPWISLDLIETLLNIGEGDKKVKKLFESPLKQYPEHMLYGIAQSNTQNILLQKELLHFIFHLFVKSHKNSYTVLQNFLNLNQNLFIIMISETFIKNPSSIRTILDIGQNLKCISLIVENTKYFKFALELGILASKRDHIHLEHWLKNSIQKYRDQFVQEMILFLQSKQDLSQEVSSIFLKSISQYFVQFKKTINPELIQEIQNLIQGQEIQDVQSTTEYQIPQEIEKKASVFFEDIFSKKITVEDAISTMLTLKSSQKQEDQELYSCMIHNLFDEYRFFEQYPIQELQIVGKLFGSIIQNSVIHSKTLRYALIYVLQALSNPNNTKMYLFGTCALNEFKSSISEWPQFCLHLKKLHHLMNSNQEIALIVNKTVEENSPKDIQEIKQAQLAKGVQLEENVRNINAYNVKTPDSSPMKRNVHTPSQESETNWNTDKENSFSFSMDISTIQQNEKGVEILVPDEKTMDKIHFIINNISLNNMNEKCNEFKGMIKNEQYYGYLASYIVVNRVSIEPNFHSLYKKFIETLNIKILDEYILKYTFSSVKKLLESDRITSSISDSERSLLKNLGSWLGLITIGNNKPILKKDLDLKQLILDAYENGRMIAILPFIAKIMNSCAISKVIKPPNPWVMGIISLLVEIHKIQRLKLNLKFEIEMLCKKLKLNINEIETKDQLQGKEFKVKPNPDLVPEKDKQEQPKQEKEEKLKIKEIPEIPLGFTELKNLVKINETIQLFQEYPQLKILVPVSIDRSLREIIAPFVKRSVTIACRTTLELVSKDFAIQEDDHQMKKVALSMVQNLSANLAMVTCKDPLRFSIETRLGNLLQSAIIGDANQQIEKAVQIISSDNLDIACAFVEKAAKEKAIMDMNESLNNELEQRKKSHKVLLPNQIKNYNIPEDLIHLNAIQVYEEFKDIKQMVIPEEKSIDTLDKLFILIDEFLEKEVKMIEKNPSSAVEVQKKLLSYSSTIQSICSKYENCNLVTQRFMKKLFESDSRLVSEYYAFLLKSIKDKVYKLIFNIWDSWPIEKKLNKDIIIELLRHELISFQDFDQNMVKEENPKTFEYLYPIIKSEQKILTLLPKITEMMKQNRNEINDENKLSQLKNYFLEWCNIIQTPGSEEKALKYIQNLQKTMIKNENDFEIFCKVILEFSIEGFHQQPKTTMNKNNVEQRTPREVLFRRLDCFSELIFYLLKLSKNQISLFTKMIQVSIQSIQKEHQEKLEEFNQRPYFRFLSNILIDINELENQELKLNFLMIFSNALFEISPIQYPGFCCSWIELMSHRTLMPKLLFSKGESQFHKLLIVLFTFLEPHLKKGELTQSITIIYRGTLKILLVLLHDFSEFLCKYHFSLCDVLPTTCIQMRNLILSAFPRHMKLPDPFTPNLIVDKLPEINQSPIILSNYISGIEKIKDSLDDYLKNRKPSTFLTELKSKLMIGDQYNIPMINSLVLYIGEKAIGNKTPAMEIFSKLILEMDAEGRYYLLNAFANQLRYPNSHTRYFSCVILYLFLEVKLEDNPELIQEQITRVLLERLIVNRPHPWGLLITFIELVKNPRYNFWKKNFIHCATEIERLFENVGKSCMQKSE